jgi:hypothetical protein
MEWRLPGRNSRTRGSSETQLKYPLHGNTMSRGHIKCFRPAHTDLLGPAAGSQSSYADPEIELGSSCAPEPWGNRIFPEYQDFGAAADSL